MFLSSSGMKMARLSGLRRIMDDIATSGRDTSGGRWLNLSIGNPAPIPEVTRFWQELYDGCVGRGLQHSFGQYGPSRGTTALVEAVVAYFRQAYSWPLTEQHVVVGPGSQTLGFAAAALFAGPAGDGHRPVVLPLVPDYTGYQGLCLHDGGVTGLPPRVEVVGERGFRYLVDLEAVDRLGEVGMLLLSTPSNPAGRAVEPAELDALVEAARRRDVPLVLDHAYGEPFPRIGETRTSPRWDEHVVNLFTVSKAGLPGERIGFAIGAERFVAPLVSFVSNTVLHASQVAQQVVAEALTGGALDRITATAVQPYYRTKREVAEKILADVLPDDVAWRLHTGRGGMFCWLWIDEPWFHDTQLYQRMKEKKVFVAPGRPFFVEDLPPGPLADHEHRCLRVSLSPEEPVLLEGLARLGDALAEMRRAS